MNFLYNGEIHFSNENDSIEIRENLSKLFGFPENLVLNDQTRHQCMTQIHPTDIEALIKMELTHDNASESMDNPNEALLDDGSHLLSNVIKAVTITEETFANIPDLPNTENDPEKFKKRYTNLGIVWIHYQKAYDT